MLWIGITGPMGSGKSTVSELLRRRGYKVVDADQVARGLLNPGSSLEVEVLRTFGEELRGEDGHLDRRALGRMVFADAKQLRRLEALLHPQVRSEVARLRTKMESAGEAVAFYDVPLLFEKKMEDQFDLIMVVSSEASLRLARVERRSGLSAAEIQERWNRQLPPEYKEARASAVVHNDGDLQDLDAELTRCLKLLKVPSPAST